MRACVWARGGRRRSTRAFRLAQEVGSRGRARFNWSPGRSSRSGASLSESSGRRLPRSRPSATLTTARGRAGTAPTHRSTRDATLRKRARLSRDATPEATCAAPAVGCARTVSRRCAATAVPMCGCYSGLRPDDRLRMVQRSLRTHARTHTHTRTRPSTHAHTYTHTHTHIHTHTNARAHTSTLTHKHTLKQICLHQRF